MRQLDVLTNASPQGDGEKLRIAAKQPPTGNEITLGEAQKEASNRAMPWRIFRIWTGTDLVTPILKQRIIATSYSNFKGTRREHLLIYCPIAVKLFEPPYNYLGTVY
jgi:hypothetical protein